MSGARWMLIVVGIVLSGCTPTSMKRRQLEALRQSYRRVRFDSVSSIIVVTHRPVDDAVSSVWSGVVELGGPVESLRGDTLIIEPYYILQWEVTPSGTLQIVRHNDKRTLPDLVFIPAGPGFRVESPSDTRRKGPNVAFFAIMGLIALDVYIRWPRG